MSRTFTLEEAFNLSMLMRRTRVYGYLKLGYDLDEIAEIEEVSTNFLRKYVLLLIKCEQIVNFFQKIQKYPLFI